jgi:endogenous inhibitor of DNA gyrase (YacG/DUF329 family)
MTVRKQGAGTTPWTCPTCGKPRVEKLRPFCSNRCANLDLGRWFEGSYVMAGDEKLGADEDEF